MTTEPIHREETERRLRDPEWFYVCSLISRPGFSEFAVELEYGYFPPDVPELNVMYEVILDQAWGFPWLLWYIGVPIEFKKTVLELLVKHGLALCKDQYLIQIGTPDLKNVQAAGNVSAKNLPECESSGLVIRKKYVGNYLVNERDHPVYKKSIFEQQRYVRENIKKGLKSAEDYEDNYADCGGEPKDEGD